MIVENNELNTNKYKYILHIFIFKYKNTQKGKLTRNIKVTKIN